MPPYSSILTLYLSRMKLLQLTSGGPSKGQMSWPNAILDVSSKFEEGVELLFGFFGSKPPRMSRVPASWNHETRAIDDKKQAHWLP